MLGGMLRRFSLKSQLINPAMSPQIEKRHFLLSFKNKEVSNYENIEIQRLADYHHYLNELLQETPSNDPEYVNLEKTTEKAKMVMENKDYFLKENEYKIDKVEDLFPFDKLLLCCKTDVPKIRRKSLPVLFPKSRTFKRKSSLETINSEVQISTDDSSNAPQKENKTCHRIYIMEAPVQLTVGLQNQERYLFLFNDMLIISKVRSNNCHKLKNKIRLCEMWIGTCIADVCEANKSNTLSFVIGWPTTNVLATFSTQEMKDLWMEKLKDLIASEKKKEQPPVITVSVNVYEQDGSHYIKSLPITHYDTTEDVIKLSLKQLDPPTSNDEAYQLWVKMDKDDTPYPLIGHEQPYSIKMKFIRDSIQGENCEIPMDVSPYINNNEPVSENCKFILKDAKQKINGITDSNKKKKRKTAIGHWSFKRMSSKSDNLTSTPNSPSGKLFGLSLTELMHNDSIPKPIMDMLQHLFDLGLFTSGIFRKSANARICREIKEKLDMDLDYDFQDVPVIVVASIIKDYIRSLPDSLLSSEKYDEWLEIVNLEETQEKLYKTKKIFEELPKVNIILLKHIICLLWHIHQRSNRNSMTAFNLGVCFSPTLLWPVNNIVSSAVESEASKKMPALIQFIIENCTQIFGVDVLKLLGEPPESRHDSGEESDHSLCGNIRRDDSSIDSLERELYIGDCDSSPNLLSKGLHSPNNLSRDSGLMMSDTQLYSPDEDLENKKNFVKTIDFNNRLSPHRQVSKEKKSCHNSYLSTNTLAKMGFYDPVEHSVYSAKVAIVKSEDHYMGNCTSLNKSISMDLLQSLEPKCLNYDPACRREIENSKTISNHRRLSKILTQSVSLEEDTSLQTKNNIETCKNFNLQLSHKPLPSKLIHQSASEIQKDVNKSSHPKRPARHKKGPAPLPNVMKDSSVAITKKYNENKNADNTFIEMCFSSSRETSRSTSPDLTVKKFSNKNKTSDRLCYNYSSTHELNVAHHFEANDSLSKVCDVTEEIFSNPDYSHLTEKKLDTFYSNVLKNTANVLESKNDTETQSSQDSGYYRHNSFSLDDSFNSCKSKMSETSSNETIPKKTKIKIQHSNSLESNKSSDGFSNQSNDNLSNSDDSWNLSIRRPLPSYSEAIHRRNSTGIFYDVKKQESPTHNITKLKCHDSLKKYKSDKSRSLKKIRNEESPPPRPPKPQNFMHSLISCSDEVDLSQTPVKKSFVITKTITEQNSKEKLTLVSNGSSNKAGMEINKKDNKLSVSQLCAIFSPGESAISKDINVVRRRSTPEQLAEEKAESQVKKRNETLRSLIKSLPGESYV